MSKNPSNIAATDVIYELENLGASFGLNISSDGLRKLARMLMAGKWHQNNSHPIATHRKT